MGGSDLVAVVLDAGALIAIERGDRSVTGTVKQAQVHGVKVVVPAGVLAQVWRGGPGQARLAAIAKGRQASIEVLDAPIARVAGELCGRRGTDDVIDASVVIAAHLHDAIVISGDADDLHRLDPHLRVQPC